MAVTSSTKRSFGFTSAMRWVGLSIAVFMVVFWSLTGRVEPYLITMSLTMMGLAEGVDAVRDLKDKSGPP